MLKSIITTTLRNLVRNKSFSLINLTGLSVSMSLGLLIIIIITEQFTYDTFHKDTDRIYRVNTTAIRKEGGRESYASVPLPVGNTLKDDYTFTEQVVRINQHLNGDVIFRNTNVPIGGLFVDQAFLNVFNFPLEKGNPATALTKPNSVVLTQAAAIKIFGTQEPIGQTIPFSGYGEFLVTGVLKKFQGNTHFEFEALASASSLPLLEKEGKITPSLDDWTNYYSGYVYIKLKAGRSKDEVEKALAKMAKTNYTSLKLEARDKGYEFYLHPLNEITPGPVLSQTMGHGMPALLIIFLSVLVGIVMIMACFNYTNLMIAKSISRAREIGVRKIVGAQRRQVFLQFTGESIIFSLLALLISWLLLQILKPAFMKLSIAQEFAANLTENYTLYFYFILFAVVVGLLAGLLPAGYLSAFKPVKVLKDSGNVKVYSRVTFRKALIVAQFTFSIIFVIVTLVIYNQINYMLTKDYGINDKNVMNVRLQGVDFQKFASEARSVNGVLKVGGVSHPLGTWADRNSEYKQLRSDESFVMRDFIVDENYIDNLEVTFLAGKNFEPAMEGQIERHVILNEKALPLFKLNDPVSAIGQTIYVQDSVMLIITGVVKDFHFRPLSYEIGPVALRYDLNDLAFLSAKINPEKAAETEAALAAIWKKLDPIHPFEMKMMEQEIDDAYADAGFNDILKIVGYICFLAISLACLGMLGMAMYTTQTKIKEIGVRKVMGATSKQIALHLSRTFLWLIGFAILIGTPLGYLLGEVFLQQYAYKAPVSILMLSAGILTIAVLGVVTISSQTLKAAALDPVKSLKYE